MLAINVDKKTEQLAADTIRFLAVDAVEKAKSGHPGAPSGMADVAYVLWMKYLRYSYKDPDWMNRDRFILSAGHASMLLYALLHLSRYDLSMDDIKSFRQWGSKTPGHPEHELTKGVEATTGPLGQGFGNGVGMAIAAKMLAAKFNRPGYPIIDNRIYSMVSDGDLMEGVSHEAASLAGHLGLGNLIYIYDNNGISIEGETELAYSDDVQKRFEGYHWHVQSIDGHDRDAIDAAIALAIAEEDKPSLIIADTHIAYGAPHKQGTKEAHGEPLGEDEVRAMKENLGWPLEPTFYVPPEVYAVFAERASQMHDLCEDWNATMRNFHQDYPGEARIWDAMMNREVPEDIMDKLLAAASTTEAEATRESSGKVMQEIARYLPGFIGGSADLAPSTKTNLKGYGSISKGHFDGRNLHFGVREHGMGTITNGLALYGGFMPFESTFLIFSDYMRPVHRIASMMRLQLFYVYTHDSIFLGEDGPTHEPIEHLTSLRAIPGLTVIRPADAAETAAAWAFALRNHHKTTALILTRQKVPQITRSDPNSARWTERGAYVVSDPEGEIHVILMASGSELQLVVEAAKMLADKGIGARVVSFPSQELFNQQDDHYREGVLPEGITNRVAVEAAAPMSWYRYVGTEGHIIGLERFGASAPAKVIAKELGFTPEAVTERVMNYLAQEE